MDMGNLLAKTAEDISVRRAFGTAYEKDGMLIIPVALVARGGGGGTARARRGNSATRRPDNVPEADATAHDVTPRDSEPQDVGGGFGGLVLPSGVYVVNGDQVRWVPVVDAWVVALATLGLIRVAARTWTRRRRSHR